VSRGRLAMRVDAVVLRVDRDAISRTNKEVKDRYLNVSVSLSGIAEMYGNVFASTARALDRRLSGCRAGQVGDVAAIDFSGRRRTPLRAVGEAGRIRPMP
jgi:hypothetical protein